MDTGIITDFSDRKTLEKYSSAFTLSDMEIFIFPELFYPLMLANIISPVLWEWRDDPWFKDIEKRGFSYKVNRIKQFIIQNYVFNLDLTTWGLTTKSREIERFRDFFDMELLKQSNALFGYEGDKYYFDIDIRKHFGLDKFDSDIIPYWKRVLYFDLNLRKLIKTRFVRPVTRNSLRLAENVLYASLSIVAFLLMI